MELINHQNYKKHIGRQIKKAKGIFGVAYNLEDVKKLLSENNLI